tara:strand:- start:732 stop:1265 length:534 start_codon:yes stop_codon:yes gene_type:complete
MSTLKVNSIIPVAGVPTGGGGGIVQIKQTVKTDNFSTTSDSLTDVTGLSVAITPTSSTSKILVQVNLGLVGGVQGSYAGFRVLRGSTAIGLGSTASGSQVDVSFIANHNRDSDWNSEGGVFFQHLDSPATTSATTYKLQVFSGYQSKELNINRSNPGDNAAYSQRTSSSITVMEVSA